MSIKSTFLGLRKQNVCDRCDKIIEHFVYHLCQNCYQIPAESVRMSDVKNDSSGDKNSMECSICTQNLLTSSFYDLCLTCISNHTDRTHYDWCYRIPPQEVQIELEGLTWANGCFSCGGVQIVRRNKDLSLDFWYYKKGQKQQTPDPYVCTKDDLQSTNKEKKKCVHKWIVVVKNLTDKKDAQRLHQEIRSNPISDIMGFDDQEMLHIAYGETSHWCWKCGCFYITSPGTNRKLPKKGTWD